MVVTNPPFHNAIINYSLPAHARMRATHPPTPFLNALMGNGKATVLFAQGTLTVASDGRCATGRYTSYAEGVAVGEKLAKELVRQAMGEACEGIVLWRKDPLSVYEALHDATRYVAEGWGLFTAELEILPELHALALEVSGLERFLEVE